jgi:hypothetical protein
VPDTRYDAASGVLTIALTPEQPTVYLSYFAPFSEERHMALVARVGASPFAAHRQAAIINIAPLYTENPYRVFVFFFVTLLVFRSPQRARPEPRRSR